MHIGKYSIFQNLPFELDGELMDGMNFDIELLTSLFCRYFSIKALIYMKWISFLLIFYCVLLHTMHKKVGEIRETNKTDNAESKPTSKVHFVPNVLLTEVMNIAESEEKLIYMDVNAKWCTPCKR